MTLPRLSLCFLFVLVLVSNTSAQPLRVNLAKYQPVQVSSALTTDPAVLATDGIVGNGSRWKTSGSPPHWLIVTLPIPMVLGSAHLYFGRDDIETVASFVLQSWDGANWINIPGTTVSGNTNTILNLIFASPVTTSKVRFYSTEAVVRVRELALFGTNGPAGYPIGTDVTLNLAKKRAVTASSIESPSYAKGAVDGYVEDSLGRWKSATVNGPHTLDVDLEVSSRIGSAHLYLGSTGNAPISNFTFQAWSGTAWTNILGGTVTGNTNRALRIQFASPADTAKVRMLMPDNGAQRVRELLLFAANNLGGYPLGTDVISNAPPTTKFDTYGDGFWKIVNRASGHSLIITPTGASTTQPASTELEKQFEILYNLDSDSFRLRNHASWQCIAAQGAGRTNGTSVLETSDYQAMPHEIWRFQDVGGGDFRIVNVWSGLALETDNAATAKVTLQAPSTNTRQYWRFEYQTHYPKKGIAGYEGEWQRFGTSWSYNWGRDTGISQPAQFIFTPMQYGQWWPDFNTLDENFSAWHTTSKPFHVLGYNEPEQSSQGNTPVNEGVALWPKLEEIDLPLVSPAPVNPFTTWIDTFYNQINAQGLRVDFTAIHWYANPSASGLISHLQNVYNTYGRPVWLTEFSCVDWGGTATWTEEDNFRFMAEFMWRAEDQTWLKRYSIFPFSGTPSTNPWDRNGHRSDFFESDGLTLTAFGELYAAWDADRTLSDRTAFFIQGLASMHRLRASSTTNALSTGNIRRSDVSAQFALAPNAAATRRYIVSLRDGRRLRFNGSVLDLAPPGTSDTSVEWTFNGPDSNGYTFIDHPATSKSLRLSRVNDGNGAPTSLDYGMENFGTANDTTRWRFIKPFAPADVGAPPPANLAATAGTNRVMLTWSIGVTNILRYTVARSLVAGGPYTVIASNIISPNFADTNVVSTNTYRYVVTATDWLESTSTNSNEVAVTPIPPGGTYANWAFFAFAANPAADKSFGGDPDGDGWKNGFEYAALTDPLVATTAPFSVGYDSLGGILFTYSRNRAATDLQFDIVTGLDVATTNWQPITTAFISQTSNGPIDRITVRPTSIAVSPQFYRLRVLKLP